MTNCTVGFFIGIYTIKVTKIFPSTLFAPTNFIHLLPFFQHRHKDFFFHFANFFSKIRKHIRRRPACSAELNVKVFMYVWKGSRLSVLSRYKKKRNGAKLDIYNQTSPRSLERNENRVGMIFLKRISLYISIHSMMMIHHKFFLCLFLLFLSSLSFGNNEGSSLLGLCLRMMMG